MSADHAWAAAFAAAASAPTGLASLAASTFDVAFDDYMTATVFSGLGIIGRHAWEAKLRGAFDVKALGFDILTAPMLGIMIYLGCLWSGQIEMRFAPLPIIFLSLLGPSWFLGLGSQMAEVLVQRIRDGKS